MVVNIFERFADPYDDTHRALGSKLLFRHDLTQRLSFKPLHHDVRAAALGVVEMALCRALERLGVRADMTAGHSYGEYVALAAAGVISEASLFDISECRGRAIKAGQPVIT